MCSAKNGGTSILVTPISGRKAKKEKPRLRGGDSRGAAELLIAGQMGQPTAVKSLFRPLSLSLPLFLNRRFGFSPLFVRPPPVFPEHLRLNVIKQNFPPEPPSNDPPSVDSSPRSVFLGVYFLLLCVYRLLELLRLHWTPVNIALPFTSRGQSAGAKIAFVCVHRHARVGPDGREKFFRNGKKWPSS